MFVSFNSKYQWNRNSLPFRKNPSSLSFLMGFVLFNFYCFSFLWIVLWTIVCLFVFLSFGNGIVCFFDLRLWLHLWDLQALLRSDFIQMCNQWDFNKRNATFICNCVFNIYIVAVVTEAYTPRAARCKLYVI